MVTVFSLDWFIGKSLYAIDLFKGRANFLTPISRPAAPVCRLLVVKIAKSWLILLRPSPAQGRARFWQGRGVLPGLLWGGLFS